MFRYLGEPLLSLSLRPIKGSKLWEASSFPYQTFYQAIENNNYISLFLNKFYFPHVDIYSCWNGNVFFDIFRPFVKIFTKKSNINTFLKNI